MPGAHSRNSEFIGLDGVGALTVLQNSSVYSNEQSGLGTTLY